MADRPRKKTRPTGGRDDNTSLRRQALDLLNRNPGQLARMQPQDLKELLHELQVHQIELEIQNEELREARQELERTQAEYASLYDHAPVGYLSLEKDGRIRRLNLNAAGMLGRSRQQLVGRHLLPFIAREDRATFLSESRRALEGGGQHVCELSLQPQRLQEGSIHVHFECRPMAPEGARPQLLRVTMTDISERARIDKQLQISRLQLETALQAGECGLWEWQVDADEAWWSPEYYRLLGYEDGAVQPGYKTFKSLLHSNDRDRVLQTINDHIHHGTPYDVEFRLRTRGGDYRWFRGRGRIIQTGRDERYMAGLLQDVTAKHEFESILAEARNKAEQANNEKTRFLAAASHDLRQPLQSLSLYLNALRRMDRPTATDEVIGKMRGSLDNMGQLLRSLLNISRLEAGQIEPEPTAFPVMELFNDILLTHGPTAQSRSLELRVHPAPWRVYSDRVMLEEIIQNFVTNALRNTDRGGVLVGCRQRGDRARIEVWDTGLGIPEDKLPLLLNPAAQETQKTGKDAGAIRPGLGLTIARQTADLLGGHLDAASRVGRGSVFAVEVPLIPEETSATGTGTEALVPAAVAPPHADITVLVVDDDAAILDACRMLSRSSGSRFECARSVWDAEELMDNGLRPDVLVCDLRLRRYPGPEVIRRLREKLKQDIPAVILTGDTSTTDPDLRSLPHCRILYKPVDFETLSSVIEEISRP